mgnify:CR=1 FL=1
MFYDNQQSCKITYKLISIYTALCLFDKKLVGYSTRILSFYTSHSTLKLCSSKEEKLQVFQDGNAPGDSDAQQSETDYPKYGFQVSYFEIVFDKINVNIEHHEIFF